MTHFLPAELVINSKEELHSVKAILDETGEEFCFSESFDPDFISHVCNLGFMPMAAEIYGVHLLLIKLHEHRSILDFNDLHIPRNVRKRSRKFMLSVDKAFDRCIELIDKHHWDSWFYKPLVDAFAHIHYTKKYRTQFHSIELWEGDELVAGEIGFVVGSAYTSLSGFYTQNSAGTIQLCTISKLLEHNNFAYWDLGMEMAYKVSLGACSINRDMFLLKQKEIANENRSLACEKKNARDIIDGILD